jgi:hypothetical protein
MYLVICSGSRWRRCGESAPCPHADPPGSPLTGELRQTEEQKWEG